MGQRTHAFAKTYKRHHRCDFQEITPNLTCLWFHENSYVSNNKALWSCGGEGKEELIELWMINYD